MDHFDAETWLLYRRDQITENQRHLMEQHLLHCDRCLQSYLASATDGEIQLAGLMLPPDFSGTVKEMIRARKLTHLKKKRSRSLGNYTAAAALTLVLMSSGIFDLCAREIPHLLQETGQISRALEKATCWDGHSLLENARAQFEKLRGNKEE